MMLVNTQSSVIHSVSFSSIQWVMAYFFIVRADSNKRMGIEALHALLQLHYFLNMFAIVIDLEMEGIKILNRWINGSGSAIKNTVCKTGVY